MLKRRIVPCLDVRGGRVVKGVRFAGLRDAGDPAERAELYERQGADEIALLDVSATLEERSAALETVRAVRERIAIPLTVGGGVRDLSTARALLAAGADRVSVNTAAVARPALIGELAAEFGSQSVVLALDAARATSGWEVVVRSGAERTGRDALAWAREAAGRGAGEVLLTSWDRDGTRSGYELDLVRAVARAVSVPVVASGGAAGPADLLAALALGAQAVLVASLLHDGDWTVAGLKEWLLGQGAEVRPCW